MRGYGGMLSFAVKGGLDAIKIFLPKLQYAHMAANLGCVETVVGPPVTTSHVECSAEERAAAGIPEGLVRYSTGIEDVEDLLADLEQALALPVTAVCEEQGCGPVPAKGLHDRPLFPGDENIMDAP